MWFKKKKEKPKHNFEITGVTLNYAAYPTLEFDHKYILPKDAEMIFYPEYYPNGRNSWPIDPKTGEKMPIKTTKA